MQKLLLWFSVFGLFSHSVMAEPMSASDSLGKLVPSLEKEKEVEALKKNRNQEQMHILPNSESIFPKSSLFSRENSMFNGEGFFAGKSSKKKSLDKPYATSNNPYIKSVETGGMKNIFPNKEREFKIPQEILDVYPEMKNPPLN